MWWANSFLIFTTLALTNVIFPICSELIVSCGRNELSWSELNGLCVGYCMILSLMTPLEPWMWVRPLEATYLWLGRLITQSFCCSTWSQVKESAWILFGVTDMKACVENECMRNSCNFTDAIIKSISIIFSLIRMMFLLNLWHSVNHFHYLAKGRDVVLRSSIDFNLDLVHWFVRPYCSRGNVAHLFTLAPLMGGTCSLLLQLKNGWINLTPFLLFLSLTWFQLNCKMGVAQEVVEWIFTCIMCPLDLCFHTESTSIEGGL